MIQHHAEAVAFARNLLGLLHLADDLRFAQDHRVEARGHAERMVRGFLLFEGVDVGLELGALHALLVGNEGKNALLRGARILAGDVKFRAVAGGKHSGFMNAALGRAAEALEHMRDRLGNFIRSEGDAFADGKRSGRMVEA